MTASPRAVSLGHLQADIAGADNDGTGRAALLESPHDGEGVAHRVQLVNPVRRSEAVQAADRRAHRDCPRADDELVVTDHVLGAVGGRDKQAAAGNIDPARRGVQPQGHPGGFQVGDGAVGEIAPVRDVAGDVVRDPADREVGERVGQHHGYLGRGIDLACTQRGADARIAAADHDQVHVQFPSLAGSAVNLMAAIG